jgi:hypothetical protein
MDCQLLISILVLAGSHGDQTVLCFIVSRVITTQTMAIPFAFQNTTYHDKVGPLYTIKAYRRSRGTAPLSLLTLALDGGKWSTSSPSRFTTGYPLNMRLGGFQRRSGRS